MSRKKALSVLIHSLVMVALAGSAQAAIWYVNRAAPGGTRGTGGTSWGTAFSTIQAGIAAAAPGDHVWVARGSYNESLTMDEVHGNGVALYGGFAGGETSPAARSWNAFSNTLNKTVIDGGGRLLSVIRMANCTTPTTIDGFIIQNGVGTVDNNACYGGGGIYLANSTADIRNNIIRQNGRTSGTLNNAGAGVYFSNAGGSLTGNILRDNSAFGGMSALYAYAGGVVLNASSPTIARNLFERNRCTERGAAIMTHVGCTPLIADNLFIGNAASKEGGAIAGFYFRRGPEYLRIYNNTFAGNQSGLPACTVFLSAGVGADLANNIFADGLPGIVALTPSQVTVSYNNLPSYTSTDLPGLVLGPGNIAADSGFVDPAAGNFHLTPSPASPCIDAGSMAFVSPSDLDLDANPRVAGSSADMGCFEARPASGELHAILYVDNHTAGFPTSPTWPTHFHTIQAAIDSSQPGDQVWVKRGTYNENISLSSAAGNGAALYGGFAGGETSLAARSWNAFSNTLNKTVIDGGGVDSVVHIVDCPDPRTRVDGFTIRNGRGGRHLSVYNYGGGIYSWQSAPSLCNNRIMGNQAPGFGYGGGIYLGASGSGTRVTCNLIENNIADGEGGGIMLGGTLSGGDPADILIAGNTFKRNSAVPLGMRGNGGGMLVVEKSPRIVSNLFMGNSANLGGGLYVSRGAYPGIFNNTFSGNTVAQSGGALYFYAFDQWRTPLAPLPGGDVANNIFVSNTSGIQRDETFAGNVNLSSNNAFGNPGGDYLGLAPGATDISADPLFAAAASGDFHLSHSPLSPCLDAGDNAFASTADRDLDGKSRVIDGVVDIGCYESGSIPPYTTCALSGTLGQNGWHTAIPVTGTLTSTDGAGSGVAAIRYAKGLVPVPWYACANGSAIAITRQGTSRLYYYAVDLDGNVEAPYHTTEVKIDTLRPFLGLTRPVSWGTYTTPLASVDLGGTVFDFTSGVSSVMWANAAGGSGTASVAGTRWSATAGSLSPGANPVTITARDMAGNAATRNLVIFVSAAPPPSADTTPPTVPFPPGGGSRRLPIVITFSEPIQAGTALSGIKVTIPRGKRVVEATRARVINGNQVILTARMQAGRTYRVTLPPSCVTDLAGNPFAGLTFNYLATRR